MSVSELLSASLSASEVSPSFQFSHLPAAEYGSFRSLLLLQSEVTLSTLMESCQLEELNRSSTGSSATAFAASSSNNNNCSFCGRSGHWQKDCRTYAAASQTAKQSAQSGAQSQSSAQQGQGQRCCRGGKSRNANAAQESPATSAAAATPAASSSSAPAASAVPSNAANIAEFAGNASFPSHSLSTTRSDWNADTGATSHMTSHRHWFYEYTPYRTPIRLANDCIVYSAGLGSVRFEPVVNGKL